MYRDPASPKAETKGLIIRLMVAHAYNFRISEAEIGLLGIPGHPGQQRFCFRKRKEKLNIYQPPATPALCG